VGASFRLQHSLLVAGAIIAAILLVRFAIDFGAEANVALAAAFWLLLASALTVSVANLAGSQKTTTEFPQSRASQSALLAAIPLAFIASSLDCTGLDLMGCSSFCTFVKLAWIPLIALTCAAYFFTGRRLMLTALAVMALVPVAPHCVCYNVANAWWIDRLGASPVCYAWGLIVSVIAIGALSRGVSARASLAVCYGIIAGAAGFFITHHYFHFPW
jgi:hypothetical protein